MPMTITSLPLRGAARVDLIVSGDADLLSMGSYQRIDIISAAAAVETLGATGKT